MSDGGKPGASTAERLGHATLAPAGAFTLLMAACLTVMVGCVLAPSLPNIAAGLGVPQLAS